MISYFTILGSTLETEPLTKRMFWYIVFKIEPLNYEISISASAGPLTLPRYDAFSIHRYRGGRVDRAGCRIAAGDRDAITP